MTGTSVSPKILRVFITGGSRGIGHSIANRFRLDGHTVFSPNRRECDLSSRASLEKFLSAFSEPIDVLVNNAGENPISNLADLELSTWDRVLQTNLTSPLMLVRHFAPLMARQGFGRIVNISSAYSSKARIGRSMYSASKAALDSLTRSAAVEFAGQGILVNSVCPGFIDTELTRKNNNPETIQKLLSRVPAGRLGTQDEIAEVVAWLGSPQNSYTSGQCIHVDGAFSIT